MKNKKVKIITTLALCLAAFIAAISAMFAWMTNAKSIQKADFKIKAIDSTIDMYSAIDSNYNGAPDLLGVNNDGKEKQYLYETTATSSSTTGDTTEGNTTGSAGETTTTTSKKEWRDYNSPYYTEKYAFKFHDSKYMLSSASSANTFETFTIADAEPSRIYTFKFSITNYSNYDGNLGFEFENSITKISDNGEANRRDLTAEQLNALKYFDCRLLLVTSTDGETATYKQMSTGTTTTTTNDGTTTTSTSEWTDFNVTESGTEGNYTYSLSETTLASSDSEIIVNKQAANSNANKVDVWLQIRMKSETKLDDLGLTAHKNEENSTKTTIATTTVTFPSFKITLTTTGAATP